MPYVPSCGAMRLSDRLNTDWLIRFWRTNPRRRPRGSQNLRAWTCLAARPGSDSLGESVGTRRAAKARRVGAPGFLTCRKRGGDTITPDAAMRSEAPWPAWKGFWAWQKVADI